MNWRLQKDDNGLLKEAVGFKGHGVRFPVTDDGVICREMHLQGDKREDQE